MLVAGTMKICLQQEHVSAAGTTTMIAGYKNDIYTLFGGNMAGHGTKLIMEHGS